jgi:hypothetical protein
MDADTPCATAIVKVEEIAGMATGLNRGRTIIRCLSRGIAVAAILTLFGVVTTGSGSAKTSTEATVTRSSTAPHQLLGKWSRNVTAAVSIEGIAKRAGAWSIVIGKSAGWTRFPSVSPALLTTTHHTLVVALPANGVKSLEPLRRIRGGS